MPLESKFLRVEFYDAIFDIPLEIIAINRAKYYVQKDIENGVVKKKDKKQAIDKEIEYALANNVECIDWASNNMDWQDVKPYAKTIYKEKPNYNEQWPNADKTIGTE